MNDGEFEEELEDEGLTLSVSSEEDGLGDEKIDLTDFGVDEEDQY